jgi:hypothetical protein
MHQSQRVKRSKESAKRVVNRIVETLEVLADAVNDPASLPAPMLENIRQFQMYELFLSKIFLVFMTIRQIVARDCRRHGPASRERSFGPVCPPKQ